LERAEKARVLTELKAELAKVLGEPGQVPPPRGWDSGGEKLLFEALPPAVQEVIHRRRDQDHRALRNCQNQIAAIRKSLPPSQPAQSTQKEIAHA